MIKCPLKYPLVKSATCLDPQVMLSSSLRKSRLKAALEVFVDTKRLTPSGADIVQQQYQEFCENVNVRKELKDFSCSSGRLDSTLYELISTNHVSSELKLFVQQILVLFHGNAAVERSFSL